MPALNDLRERARVIRLLGWEMDGRLQAIHRIPGVELDVGGWTKADYPGVALIAGTRVHEGEQKPVFGFFMEKAPAWFDAWLGRDGVLAERNQLHEGVVLWEEEPTRAAIIKRLAELNASRATTSADHVAASATNAPDAWRNLAGARLLPESWLDDPRRRFRHHVRTECDVCRGFGYSDCYARCDNGYHVTSAWKPIPETVSECAAYAEMHEVMALYEMLAIELLSRVAPWLETKRKDRVFRWSMWSEPSRGSQVPSVLEPAWAALREAGANPRPQDLSPVRGAPGWAGQGQRAWEDAVARGLRVKAVYPVPASAVGVAFADLQSPFVFASELEALPFHFFNLDDDAIYLWASDPRGSE